jgi:hypothetical protein
MRDDHSGRVRKDRRLERVPRMNDATVERSPSQCMTPAQMLRVHEQHEADFDGLMRKTVCRIAAAEPDRPTEGRRRGLASRLKTRKSGPRRTYTHT